MQIRQKITDFTIPNCKHVIIDTDAGGDDAQAIVFAISEAKRTGKTIVGITCIDGNAFLEDVIRNVLITLSICEADIPVFRGSTMSLMGPTHKDYYFSEDGFGLKQKQYISKLKEEKKYKGDLLKEQPAIEFLVESANKYANDLAIIAIGPLTNIALAYHLDNSIAEKVSMISLMGGSTSAFGIRQFFAAEFNFFLDAEAAKIVVNVFNHIYMSSFDLSLDIGTKKTLNLFLESDRKKAKLIHDIHGVILSTHRPSLCDPLAVIPVFAGEDVLYVQEAYADVETEGLRSTGCLTLDWLNTGEKVEGRHKIRAVGEINLESVIKKVDQSYN